MVLVFVATVSRETGKRGNWHVCIKTGHATRNVFLGATPLGLDALTVGAFEGRQGACIVGRSVGELPVYPVARHRGLTK